MAGRLLAPVLDSKALDDALDELGVGSLDVDDAARFLQQPFELCGQDVSLEVERWRGMEGAGDGF